MKIQHFDKLAFCLSLLLLTACVAQGQTVSIPTNGAPSEAFRPPNKERRFTSAEMLAQFEAPAAEAYRLGDGDELTLEVWGRPELSGKHVIGPDGKVSLPLLGARLFSGLSREDAAEIMRSGYLSSGLYKDLSVTVRVDRYTSQRVYILGRVASPGVLEFPSTPTLLEAITRAGSLPIGDNSQKAALTRCAVFRGRDRIVWIDLKPLLTSGDLSANIRLQRNDLIYIPDADDQLIYVMGEVNKPGAYRLTPDMSFMDALNQAGGPSKDAADKIQLIRSNKGLSREISFSHILKAKNDSNFSLEEGDVIYVHKRGLAKFGYVMEKLSPVSSMLLLGSALTK